MLSSNIVDKSQSLVWMTFKVTKLKSQKFSIIQWLWLINSVKKKKKKQKLMSFQLFLLLLLSHFCFTRVVVGPVITRSSLTIFEPLQNKIGMLSKDFKIHIQSITRMGLLKQRSYCLTLPVKKHFQNIETWFFLCLIITFLPVILLLKNK